MIKKIDDVRYKYLSIPNYNQVKQTEIKDIFFREYKQRLTLVLQTKLNGKKTILVINTLTVTVLQYSAGML